MRQRVTQKQVAQKAGVTRATVSYVVTGRAAELNITPEVISRVNEAMQELGYTPNHAAQTLVSGRSRTLGLVAGTATGNPMAFWTPIVEGVMNAVLKSGYDVLVLQSPGGAVAGATQALQTSRVDAVIAVGFMEVESAADWQDVPVPPVVAALVDPVALPCVTLDTTQAYYDALEHLRRYGHRKVAYARPQVDIPARTADLRKAADELGLELAEVVAGDITPQTNALDARIALWRERLEERLKGVDLPSAIVCWNDEMALALGGLLNERGLNVPGDVSIIGFDDVVATAGIPPLSTVSHEFDKIGEALAKLALQIAGKELGMEEACKTTVSVPARFIPRASTGPARSA